ncbi:MAG: hypothetical protein LBU57_07455 [Dysgonamonadaceae bacterium]|jgi:fibronectin type 3 domain-containing protein|nr:hypothetical protein [Dysgonamonadaceae bacterium]
MLEIPKKLPTFIPELFDSIAPQNAEICTVTNSLPLNFKNSAKNLFFNRLCQTDENLKYVFTGILFSLGYFPVFSQNQPDSSRIILRISVSEPAIKLRWAANNPILWKKCLQHGFSIERYTLSKDGKILEEREKTILATQIKPAPLSDWEIPANRNEYAAVIAQAIYGESFEVTGMQTTDLQGMVNRTLELEQRYNFALYCADMNLEAATLAGWAFTDNQIVPGECYLYRVIPLSDAPSAAGINPDQYGFDHGCAGEITSLPSPIYFHADFGDKSVMLYWDNKIMKHFFSAYQIERSENNTDFKPVGKPVASVGNEYDGYAMFMDSIPANNVTFYYRIRGINSFGEPGPPSDTIQGMGNPSLKYVPQITGAQVNDDGSADVEWIFDEKGNKEIHSFTIMQSSHFSGEYIPLMDHISNLDRKIRLENPMSVNYLIVVAEPLQGKSTRSHPYLLMLPDSIPPAAPTGLTAQIDTTGIVYLQWTANHEPDLGGYRIYKHNLREEEPVVIRDSLLQEAFYTDSIGLDNLNPYIYYTVKALDKHYNQSEFSQHLQVEKPLRTLPSSPVINSFNIEKDGIFLRWINCEDQICARHILYRRQEGYSEYDTVRIFEGREISDYKDTSVKEGVTYTYHLTAQSKWGVESLPSSSLQVTSAIPNHPQIIRDFRYKRNDDKLEIGFSWEVLSPEKIKLFRIYRSENQAPVSLWKETNNFSITDNNHKTGYTYRYQLHAVLNDGRVSDKKEITIKY